MEQVDTSVYYIVVKSLPGADFMPIFNCHSLL